METLSTVIEFEVWLLLLGLMLAVAYQILTGKINTKELLSDDYGRPSPQKVQLLIFTVVGALYYLFDTMGAASLPEVPQSLLVLVGGSNLVYVGGKAVPGITRAWHRARLDAQTREEGNSS